MRLEGKTALVTGGGTGIGKAIAKGFVKEGAKVCITGRRQEMLDKVAAELPSESIVTCASDVTNYDDILRMVETTINFGGKIDILVNNAGIDPPGTVVDADPELWQQVMDINLTGPFLTMKAVIPHMIENGGGSIINVSSLGGTVALPGMAPYCTTKAGLIMLSKQAALDYGAQKIRVNALCPGATRTEMLEGAMQGLAEVLNTDTDGAFGVMSQNIPLKRVAMPDEMIGISVFLASDESSFMTAATVLVDGGASIVDISGASLSNAGIKWG
ncbi:SDR family NAD(P)-dependent oxidoreductase [Thermodesulfobacteriota bacterium]